MSSIYFAVGILAGEYFVINTHAIDNRIGGNGNGIVIQFPNVLSCLCWIIKRFHASGVKASTFQSLYEVSFPIMDDFYRNLHMILRFKVILVH